MLSTSNKCVISHHQLGQHFQQPLPSTTFFQINIFCRAKTNLPTTITFDQRSQYSVLRQAASTAQCINLKRIECAFCTMKPCHINSHLDQVANAAKHFKTSCKQKMLETVGIYLKITHNWIWHRRRQSHPSGEQNETHRKRILEMGKGSRMKTKRTGMNAKNSRPRQTFGIRDACEVYPIYSIDLRIAFSKPDPVQRQKCLMPRLLVVPSPPTEESNG